MGAILGIAQQLGCNQVAPEFDLASDEWVIGKGFSDKDGVPVNEILNTANEGSISCSGFIITANRFSSRYRFYYWIVGML